MYIGLHVNYPFLLSSYKDTWISPTDFPKNTQISNFIKIRPVEAEVFHADRHNEAKSRFPPFCEHAKKKKNVDSTLTLIMFLRFLQVWHPAAVQLRWVTGRAWQTFQIDSDSYNQPYISRRLTRFSGSMKNLSRCCVKNDGLATTKPRIQGSMGWPTWKISLPRPYSSFPDWAVAVATSKQN